MSVLISDYVKFIALYIKSKDAMVFNGLIGLGTVVGQTAYNILAFECPCSEKKNYLYGLAAIGVPALAFFVIGVMLNRNTWEVVSECRTRKCRKLSGTAAFALLGSIVGRAVVAPITWSVISLLRGVAYVCAFSEFVDPSSLDNFPPTTKIPEIMARFPCKDVPARYVNYSRVIERQLKYESQLLGWLLVGIISLSVILLLCLKNCFSTLGYHQEAYWSQYRYSEQVLFQRTAEVHAKYNAAENVKNFFGFVALDKEEKELLANCQGIKSVIPRMEWNRITGVYIYREIDDTPLYSRLNKWAMYTNEHGYVKKLNVKLIDFGCGDLLTESAYMSFSGTVMYCPPEFRMKGEFHGKPATVWSLGILLFRMLCGNFPDSFDLYRIKMNTWNKPELTEECCDLICSLMQQKPEGRLDLGRIVQHKWCETVSPEVSSVHCVWPTESTVLSIIRFSLLTWRSNISI